MKKTLFALLIICLMPSCATQHNVGETHEAGKAKKANASRVGSQFNGVR